MYNRIIIFGYKFGSASVKALKGGFLTATKIKVLRVKFGSPTYKNKPTHYVIHWGKYNAMVSDKLETFKLFAKHNSDHTLYPAYQINYPEWTTDKQVAQEWYNSCQTVVARALLNSHSGKGITLHNGENSDLNPYFVPLPDVPLYVKYKKKAEEYRVHVFKGKIIDVAQKKKRKGAENVDTKIRNHQNGWVYCRENLTEPHDLRTQALLAADATGLVHGAIDVIYNKHENKCYVLEINTAPGITGTTVQKYVDAFIGDMNEA